jgi:hypothetical protein
MAAMRHIMVDSSCVGGHPSVRLNATPQKPAELKTLHVAARCQVIVPAGFYQFEGWSKCGSNRFRS